MNLHAIYPVGALCQVGEACMGNKAGSVALVYENYTIGDRDGISLLFPNGDNVGFRVEDMRRCNVESLARTCATVRGYKFENVMKLGADFLLVAGFSGIHFHKYNSW